MLAGSGTLVTGGTIVNPQRRTSTQEEVTQINGPGVSGDSIQGGVSRRIAKGDMVIILAGTPHWFSEIQETLTYMVVRVDPSRVVTKVSQAIQERPSRLWVVTQFEMCPIRPEKHGTDRPLQNPPTIVGSRPPVVGAGICLRFGGI